VITSHKALVTGEVFNYKYSPRESDPAWFGFIKVECQHCSGFFSYITVRMSVCLLVHKCFDIIYLSQVHIVVVLLLACSYYVSRRQVRVVVVIVSSVLTACICICQGTGSHKTLLLSDFSDKEMNQSIIKSISYLIDHIFELYGLKVSASFSVLRVAVLSFRRLKVNA